MPQSLMPRQPVPSLEVPTLSGQTLSLQAGRARNFTMLVFYRGYHCPLCRAYLTELNRLSNEFEVRGVEILVLSSDKRERAEKTRQEWFLDHLDLGYELDLEVARHWGLYVSTGRGLTSIGIEEPSLFSEPGIFLIRPDLTLFWASIQTMPFARPHFKEMLSAIDFVLTKNYPARGEA